MVSGLEIGDWGPTTITSSPKGRRDSVTDVVLPAHRREAAALAAIDIVGLWREFAGRHRVERVGETLLRCDKPSRAMGRRRERRHAARRSFEAQVRRLAQGPIAPAVRCEPLFGADAVDGQLQRPGTIRRPAELVVDEPEGAVLEEIHAIGLAAQGYGARAVRCGDGELTLKPSLEQPFDDSDRTFGFHAEDGFTQARSRRRSQQARAFQASLGARQPLERPIDNLGEHLTRKIEVGRRDFAVSGLLPRSEELLEHLVDKLSLPPRVHHFFVVRLLLQLEDVLCEELEWTVEIGLERAHRPGTGTGTRPQGPVEFPRLGS